MLMSYDADEQGHSDSTCSLMACGDRENGCSGRLLRVQTMLVPVCFVILILFGVF